VLRCRLSISGPEKCMRRKVASMLFDLGYPRPVACIGLPGTADAERLRRRMMRRAASFGSSQGANKTGRIV